MLHLSGSMGTRTQVCREKAHYIEVYSDSDEDDYEQEAT